MDIQIQNKVTTTTTTTETIETTVAPAAPIDRSNEKLVDNSTTFDDLLYILADNPEVRVNAKVEAEERAAEAKEAKLREELGDDYDLVFDKKKADNGRRQCLSANYLRTSVPRIAFIAIGDDGVCEVFSNGYAIYDNGNRKTVLWVQDCGSATYYFGELKDSEKEYLPQSAEIDSDEMGKLPWYNAVMVAGENRIEYNMMKHPKSKSSASDFEFDEAYVKSAAGWVGGTHFDTPEEAYLKKEAAEERRKAMTDKQMEVYTMYYEWGMSLEEIGKELGIDRYSVWNRIECIKKKMKKNPENFFSTDTPQNGL